MMNPTMFKEEFEQQFPHLDFEFIRAMDEIGDLGKQKYQDDSVIAKVKRGDVSRTPRTTSLANMKHARDHFKEYVNGIKHDVFLTRIHQLAASAFNAMMESMLSELRRDNVNQDLSDFWTKLKNNTYFENSINCLGDSE